MCYSPEPPVFGGALRIHYLLKNLAERHNVTVVCFGDPGTEEAIRAAFSPGPKNIFVVPYPWPRRFRRLAQAASHFTSSSFSQLSCNSKKMQATLDLVVSRYPFDLVVTEFPMMGIYKLATNAKRVLDAHNVENDTYFRMSKNETSWLRRHHYHAEHLKLRREELAVCKGLDAVWVTSSRDGEFFRAMAPNVPCFVVPNGVDTSYSSPDLSAPEPHSMVFTGMMGYVPNSDGILDFLDNIFPLILREIPDAKLYVVGSQPPAELRKRAAANVIVTGFVDDVRPYIRRAKAVIVPLRMGGGTRLKILEAFAMKKPVVSTSIGREGISTGMEQAIYVADDAISFASRVLDILADKVDYESVAENGHRLARERYDWDIIGENVEINIQQLVQPKKVKQESAIHETANF
jgi:glycosyltransferase involved in cell wall biosynthesis